MSQKELIDLSVKALNVENFNEENFKRILDKLDTTGQQTIDRYAKINTGSLSGDLSKSLSRRNF